MSTIRVSDVHKKFKVYFDKGQTFKERLLFRNRNYHEDRWVLKGVSFEVEKGEAIGLIGENGCGKSTLLKLMTKILYPDHGEIEINGRISSLIELGAGFHPDMSGRENIYTNASIFGLTKNEIDARLNDIITFSELEDFIDNPVRTYSSGMYMRLAFSVAINVDADVLLIDEILAVGDANFQSKCFDKLREIKAKGTTIVIVSHSLGQIEQICERSIWINDGVIQMIGSPYDVHHHYLDFMGQKRHGSANELIAEEVAPEEIVLETSTDSNGLKEETQEQDENAQKRFGSGEARILSVKLYNDAGMRKNDYQIGEKMEVKIAYKTYKNLNNPTIGINIFRNDGLNCYGTNTYIDGLNNIHLKDKGEISFIVEKNNLLEGEYTLDVAIHADNGFDYDYLKGALQFQMYGNNNGIGVAKLDHQWIIDN